MLFYHYISLPTQNISNIPKTTLYAWGLNSFGQLGDGTTINRSTPVSLNAQFSPTSSSGNNHTAIVYSDGSLYMTGLNSFGQLGDGTTINKSTPVKLGSSSWTTVSAQADSTVGLTIDGILFSWGRNSSGELGLGDTDNRSSPVQVTGYSTSASYGSWAAVSTENGFNLAIKSSDSSLWSWGENSVGQLGDGSTINKSTPVLISKKSWSVVNAGASFATAITTTGVLYAWGQNNTGQLGDGTTINKSAPVQINLGLIGAASFSGSGQYLDFDGANLALGTGDFTIEMWAYANSYGSGASDSRLAGSQNASNAGWQMAIRNSGTINFGSWLTATDSTLLAPVQTWNHIAWTRQSGVEKLFINGVLSNTVTRSLDMTTTAASIGRVSSTANLWNGYVSNFRIVKGTAVYTSAFTPPTSPLTAITNTVFLTGNSRAIVDNSGNNYTITNTGSVTATNFTPFASSVNVSTVSTGSSHTVAIDTNGALYAWGSNATGQLGDNTTVNKSSPVLIGSSSWTSITAAASHTAAITSNGKLFAWGGNSTGQLGDGTTINKSSPVQVGTSSWTTVSSNNLNTIGVDTAGRLYAWGNNATGQLGDGTTLNKSSPVVVNPVATNSSWRSISTSRGSYTVAIRSQDSSLWTWGDNANGKLGDGTTVNKSQPIKIGSDSWSVVSAGLSSAFGITTAGILFAWGGNSLYQLGDGTTINKSSPVNIPNGISTNSFNTNSVLFNGSNQTLTVPYSSVALGTSNFTIEFWMKTVTPGAAQSLIGNASTPGSGTQYGTSHWVIQIGSANTKLVMTYLPFGIGFLTSTTTVTDGNWYHVAVTRSADTFKMYINGVLESTYTSSAAASMDVGSTTVLGIGAFDAGSFFSGYISNLRMANTVVYNYNFTAPTANLSAVSGTTLLTGQSATIIDNSGNNLTITNNNTATAPAITISASLSTFSSSWSAVSAGDSHTTAIDVAGNLWAWGSNATGQVGYVTNQSSYSKPTKIPSAGTQYSWKQLVANDDGTLTAGITTDGALYTWGNNSIGQLGDGTTVNKSQPVKIGSSSWNIVTAGFSHISAIDTTGKLYAWGLNTSGQLGDYTITSKSSPVIIGIPNTYSVSMSPVTQYLSVPNSANYNFGTTPFTVEMWFNSTDARTAMLASYWNTSNALRAWQIGVNASMIPFVNINGVATTLFNSAVTIGSWNHLAFVGTGTTMYLYLNGVSQGTPIAQSFTGVATDALWIGQNNDGGGTNQYNGYISNFRIVKGTAVYTSNFTPSITPLTAVANTVLLTCNSSTIIDNSGLNVPVTVFGNAPVSRIVPLNTNASWTAISAGASHTTAIDLEGNLYAWGNNAAGQVGYISGIATFSTPTKIQAAGSSYSWKQLVAGGAGDLTAGITTTGTLYTWGGNNNGQLGDGTIVNKSSPTQIGTSSWNIVAAGFSHMAAIDVNGNLYAWGRNADSQLGDNTTTAKSSPVAIPVIDITSFKAKQVIISDRSTLAIRQSDGSLWAWGRGNEGQLGDGTTISKSTPIKIGSSSWTVLATRSSQDTNITNYAIDINGRLFAWGSNTLGQIGDGTTVNKSSPVQIGSSSWSTVSGNGLQVSAIDTTGTLYGWGLNSSGQIGDGTVVNKSSPVKIGSSSWSTVSCGSNWVMAITSTGSLFTWGSNASGQMGDGTTVNKSSPVSIGTSSWSIIAADGVHGAAIDMNKRLFTWGSNALGQMGDNTTVSKSSPVLIGTSSWSTVSAGESHTTAIDINGRLFAWGLNSSGQLGDGTTVTKSSPVLIGLGNVLWKSVSAGFSNTGAVDETDTVYAWGLGTSGQLGDNTVVSKSSPVLVSTTVTTFSSWSFVSAGASHTTAIDTSGNLYAWGTNGVGQIGDSTVVTKSTPVKISIPLTATYRFWKQIDMSSTHTLAITNDGSLFAWGDNGAGALGDGTTIIRSSPVQIGTLRSWSIVSAGVSFSTALDISGRLWAWGSNALGQLGDSTVTSKSAPTLILNKSWSKISAGASHIAAIDTTGNLWTWGSNVYGRLGDGTTVNKSSPIQVSAGRSWSIVAAGNQHTKGITTLGKLYGWGVNGLDSSYEVGFNAGQTYLTAVEIPDNTSTYRSWTAVSVWGHTAAIDITGALYMWGAGNAGVLANNGTTTQTTPTKFDGISWSVVSAAKGIATNGTHTLAIDLNGNLYAWGVNFGGTFGDGSTTARSSPVQIGQGSFYTKVVGAGDGGRSAAITTNNELYVWGSPGAYLGDNTAVAKSSPVLISASVASASFSSWSAVSAGMTHTVGTTIDGVLFTWGFNGQGQLGDGTTVNKSTPTKLSLIKVPRYTWKKVSAGGGGGTIGYTHAIRSDGAMFAWGSNLDGYLGDGTAVAKSSPVRVGKWPQDRVFSYSAGPFVSWAQVSSGISHAIAITNTGIAYGLGDNTQGQYGINNITGQISLGYAPYTQTVYTTIPWKSVAAGYLHNVAIKLSDSSLWTWGVGLNGQLGEGFAVSRSIPTAIGASSWAVVAAGNSNSAAIDINGRLFTWGYGNNGNIGDGTTVSKSSPVLIGSSSWTKVAVGNSHSIAIDINGSLYSWGGGSSGQLGDGTTVQRSTLTKIGTSSWSSISTGTSHSAGITISGSLFTWGNNATGQLGDGTTINKSSPVQIGTSSWAMVYAGQTYTAAIDASGLLYTWGQNTAGQLGDGTTVSKSSPVLLPSTEFSTTDTFGVSWTSISAGQSHTAALSINKALYAWGLGSSGQLGDGTTVNKSTPISIDLGTTTLPISYSVSFNGTTQLLRAPSTGTNTGFICTGDFTVEGWFYPTSASGTYSLFTLGTEAAARYTWFLVNGVVTSNLYGSGSTSYTGTISANVWTHIAVVRLGSTVKVYINGVTNATTETQSGTIGNGVLNIGADGSGATLFAGNISNFRVVKGDAVYTANFTPSLTPLISINNTSLLTCKSSTIIDNGGSGITITNTGTATVSSTLTPFTSSVAAGSWSVVSAGGIHTEAIRTNGTLWAWGLGTSGQLGDNTVVSKSSPIQVGTLSWSKISAGGTHTVGITSANTLYTWGLGTSGQLGDITAVTKSSPVLITTYNEALNTFSSWTTVSAGISHTAAITTAGALFGWGLNSSGQVGDGTTINKLGPTQTSSLTNTGYSVAFNGAQYLNVPSSGSSAQFTPAGNFTFEGWFYLQVGGGNIAVFGIETTGRWSVFFNGAQIQSNAYGFGNVGFGSVTLNTWNHVAIVRSSGTITVYINGTSTGTTTASVGNGYLNSIGNGLTGAISNLRYNNTTAVYTSNFTPPTSPLTAIANTTLLTCQSATIVDNSTNAFTINDQGRPAVIPITPFTTAATAKSWTAVSAGGAHTLATDTTGTLYGWGGNAGGQVGTNSFVNGSLPTAVSVGAVNQMSKISYGDSHVVAVDTLGGLWAWGGNTSGQLGDGTVVARSQPIKIGNSSWSVVSAHGQQTFGITSVGTLWAWGLNTTAQLGDNTTVSKSSPVKIDTLTNTLTDFSTNAVSFNGTSQYLTASANALFALGAGNFTIEFFSYSNGGNCLLMATRLQNGGANGTWGIYWSSGKWIFSEILGSPTTSVTTNGTYEHNQWYHVAIVRSGSTLSIYVNGQLDIAGSSSTNFNNSTYPFYIGTDPGGYSFFSGYLSNLRIVKGTAVYTSNFVPPTANLTAIANTSLLTCQSATIVDNSGNSIALTNTGTATVTSNTIPVVTATSATGLSWSAVSAGGTHAVAIDSTGSLYTWGSNAIGQLGNGATITKSLPQKIGTSSWSTISASFSHTAGVTTNGALFTWGGNASGQIGDGTTINKSSPVQIGTLSWTSVSTGGSHTAGISTTKGLYTWGGNSLGQVGDGTTINKSSPVLIASGSSWTSVSAGGSNISAIDTIGRLWAWGLGTSGQLGDNTAVTKSSPVQIGTSSWSLVGTGSSTTSGGIITNGSLFTWGLGTSGQLGDNTVVSKSSPVLITTLNYPIVSWTSISAGGSHSAAVDTTGGLYTWGSNATGQLGDGATLRQSLITKIGSLYNTPSTSSWSAVSAGGSHTAAQPSTGTNTLFVWGYNNVGQLGDGTTVNKSSPVLIGVYNEALNNYTYSWSSVSAGSSHTAAIQSTGALWTWGSNATGQIGTGGTVSNQVSPTQIGLSSWLTVSAGSSHTAGITTANTLFTWGGNALGQLGDNTTVNKSSPVQIGTSSWSAVSAGTTHTAGVTANNLFTWGLGTSGQLGDNTVVSKSSPVQVSAALSYSTGSFSANTVSFNGTNQYLSIASNSQTAFQSNNFTIEGWFYFANGSTNVNSVITTNYTSFSAGSNSIYFGKHTSGSGAVSFWCSNYSAAGPFLNDPTLPPTNQWVHYAIVRNGNTFTMYRNGDKVATGTFASSITAATNALWIGTDGSSPGTIPFSGFISNFRIVNGTAVYTSNFTPPITSLTAIANTGLLTCQSATIIDNSGNNLTITNNGTATVSANTISASLPTWTSWSAVSAGGLNTMATDVTNTLYGWGSNATGQIGDGTTISKSSPVLTSLVPYTFTPTSWTNVMAGTSHLGAITSIGELYTWGSSVTGQIGDGTTINKSVPVKIGTSSWSKISAGSSHTAGITSTNTLYSWGGNSLGQVGDGTTINKSSPVQIGFDTVLENSFNLISSGTGNFFYGRGISGNLYSWGNNTTSQLGSASGGYSVIARTILPTANAFTAANRVWSKISLGAAHTLAIDTSGGLWTWGLGTSGQLGDSTTASKSSPVKIGTSSWTYVKAGPNFSSAIDIAGRLFCWSNNDRGSPAYNNTTITSPILVGASYKIVGSNVGSGQNNQSFWLDLNGTATFQGFAVAGEKGDGSSGNFGSSGGPALSGSSWTIVGVGGQTYGAPGGYVVGITITGALYAWGANPYGNLGDNSVTQKAVWTNKIGNSSWTYVDAGNTFNTVGIDINGRLFCWGDNTYGELGDGTTINKSSPIQIGTSSWTAVNAYYGTTLAIDIRGRLFAWGLNSSGQIGDGTTVNKSSPVQIGITKSNWVSVSTGQGHSAAIDNTGTLYTWGLDSSGQLGNLK